jgi:hypothetical protein
MEKRRRPIPLPPLRRAPPRSSDAPGYIPATYISHLSNPGYIHLPNRVTSLKSWLHPSPKSSQSRGVSVTIAAKISPRKLEGAAEISARSTTAEATARIWRPDATHPRASRGIGERERNWKHPKRKSCSFPRSTGMRLFFFF